MEPWLEMKLYLSDAIALVATAGVVVTTRTTTTA